MSADYQTLLDQFGIKHFSAEEVFVKGNAHADPRHRGYQLNTDPPRSLWLNSIWTLKILDMARDVIGAPLLISSFYRSRSYNTAVGGGKTSYHMSFLAGDVSSPTVEPTEIHQVLQDLREAGYFTGGIGLYDTFVHVDNRGFLASWNNSTIPHDQPT